MRQLAGLIFSAAIVSTGCTAGVLSPQDAGAPASFFIETGADQKALLYNLVGRWYPEDEIKRFSDRTLTAAQWCEREPSTIFLAPEKVEVRCTKGSVDEATIAKVSRESDGTITIRLRTKEDSNMRELRVLARGPKATITGSPCASGPVEYGRFPEYEILSREILGNRRCAQLTTEEPLGESQ